METKQRKVGRPKAPPRTGPLVLGEDYARTKLTLEISERAAEELAEYTRWVEKWVRDRRERGEIQDGRFRATRDLPARPDLAGRAARSLGAGQGPSGRDGTAGAGRDAAAGVGTASRGRDSSLPTATQPRQPRAIRR